LFGHSYTYNGADTGGSTGYGEIPGNDFIVTMNRCDPSDNGVGNTIMHELGHNLYLRHGGYEDFNCKPNYNSVMNYLFQFPGIDTDCDGVGDDILDYSRGSLAQLDENSLDESIGLCGVAIDWNGNGSADETGVAFNVTNVPSIDQCSDEELTPLDDWDDWSAVELRAVTYSNAPALVRSFASPLTLCPPAP
jgi:hypothetical protein